MLKVKRRNPENGKQFSIAKEAFILFKCLLRSLFYVMFNILVLFNFQVIAVSKSSDIVLMVLDASKVIYFLFAWPDYLHAD